MSRFAPKHATVAQCLFEPVVDRNGLPAGVIRDLLIDRHSGHVDYVQVTVEPYGPGSGRGITVPWSVLRPPGSRVERWRLAVARETLQRMARFEARG